MSCFGVHWVTSFRVGPVSAPRARVGTGPLVHRLGAWERRAPRRPAPRVCRIAGIMHGVRQRFTAHAGSQPRGPPSRPGRRPDLRRRVRSPRLGLRPLARLTCRPRPGAVPRSTSRWWVRQRAPLSHSHPYMIVAGWRESGGCSGGVPGMGIGEGRTGGSRSRDGLGVRDSPGVGAGGGARGGWRHRLGWGSWGLGAIPARARARAPVRAGARAGAGAGAGAGRGG
jgi:hypothetical protein